MTESGRADEQLQVIARFEVRHRSYLAPDGSIHLRISATASFVAFAVMASFNAGCCAPSFLSLPSLSGALPGRPGNGPPICTGVAAPRLVPGAMAAICVAKRM